MGNISLTPGSIQEKKIIVLMAVIHDNFVSDKKYSAHLTLPRSSMRVYYPNKSCISNVFKFLTQNFSSRMAAIDYSVCLHSEVFVTTQGGNFPQFLIGHRRYLYGGHSKTIKPDKRKLALLFDNRNIGFASLFISFSVFLVELIKTDLSV